MFTNFTDLESSTKVLSMKFGHAVPTYDRFKHSMKVFSMKWSLLSSSYRSVKVFSLESFPLYGAVVSFSSFFLLVLTPYEKLNMPLIFAGLNIVKKVFQNLRDCILCERGPRHRVSNGLKLFHNATVTMINISYYYIA